MCSPAMERPESTKPSTRLVSLDVLRGITVAFMILVNNNADPRAYWVLQHAKWNGCTPTDLVFPTFLFLVGTSLIFSFDGRLSRGASKMSLLLHSVRRAAVIFLLGLVVNGFPFFHWSTLRIYGVLQRIAICFLFASILYLWDQGVASKVVLLIVSLLGYWILMRWIPVPGYGMPGVDIPLLDKDANLVAALDRHIFPGRLYEQVRDPEGLLSTLPALGTILMGMLTGLWLRTKRSFQQKAAGMLAAGIAATALGVLWNHRFPMNKKLWTSSYVLFAGGWALIALALCYWVIEIKGWKRFWTPFWLVFGTNALLAYMFSELLAPILQVIQLHDGLSLQRHLYQALFVPLGSPANASLLYSISFVLACWIPVALLYRRRIFIKI